MPPVVLPILIHLMSWEMVVRSHTTLGLFTKQETKFPSSSPMTPFAPSSMSAKPGQMVPIVMQVLNILLDLTMLIWDGLSRDIVMEHLHLLLRPFYTPLLPNADGTIERKPSPLIIGPSLLFPLIFLEPVFGNRIGSTNARGGQMVYGARWQPTNRR